jgi:hypothetical protein
LFEVLFFHSDATSDPPREIADDRKASNAGLEQVDTPELLLEKV